MRAAEAAGDATKAQEVVGYAFMTVEPLIRPRGEGRKRLQWVTKWLSDALVFRAEMHPLRIALEALDRGDTLPLLKPKTGGRQGGTRRTRDRLEMRDAVEAARELRRLADDRATYDLWLEECGTAPSTIHGYARKLAGSLHEPRASYILTHGFEHPRDVLIRAIEELPTR